MSEEKFARKMITKVYPLYPTLRKMEVKVSKMRACRMILLFLGKSSTNP